MQYLLHILTTVRITCFVLFPCDRCTQAKIFSENSERKQVDVQPRGAKGKHLVTLTLPFGVNLFFYVKLKQKDMQFLMQFGLWLEKYNSFLFCVEQLK